MSKKEKDLFLEMKEKILEMDPVYWCEKYLTIDGKPLKLRDGWEPYIDIYRYVGVTALTRKGKKVIFLKGRQVGGTMAALFIELFLLASGQYGTKTKPPIRIMHCFPQLEMARRFSVTKFDTVVNTSKLVDSPKDKIKKIPYIETRIMPDADSQQLKYFQGGNHIFIESTGLTGDRLRGITADIFLGDEIQDMRTAAIENATKSLTQAQYGATGDGVQFYFGTPKKKGSDFHKRWSVSNQQFYHLGCEKCQQDFPLYTPGSDDWENIWIEDSLPESHPSHGFIVKCVHCGHEQDKRAAAKRGKWVCYNKDPKSQYMGYHLNQLYIPNFPRWKVIGEKPENHPVNTERAYRNEILGEFYSGTSQPITTDEIDQICGEQTMMLASRLSSSPDRKIIIGFDWGQKVEDSGAGDEESSGGKSYSVAIVLVQEGPKLFRVAWAERFMKNDLDYKVERAEQLFRRYNPDLALGDIGFGYEICKILQKRYGHKFLAASGLHNVTGKYRLKEEDNLNTVIFEKDYVLEQIFEKFKRGEIKFPYKDYEKIAWLVEHCASMDTKVTYDRSGEPMTKYVKGHIPNDGLMGLTYAYVGALSLASNNFKIKNPDNYKEAGASKDPPITLGYLPRWR
jgi:hypothetical protein